MFDKGLQNMGLWSRSAIASKPGKNI